MGWTCSALNYPYVPAKHACLAHIPTNHHEACNLGQEAAKKFGKRFACGASVVKDASNKEEIDVQVQRQFP